MAYNIDIEYRIDNLAAGLPELVKKKMFGGVGYLVNGNMCFGIHKEYLIVRTSPETATGLLKSEDIKPFDITGKIMKGWLMISPDYVETDEMLFSMLQLGVSFAENLPGK